MLPSFLGWLRTCDIPFVQGIANYIRSVLYDKEYALHNETLRFGGDWCSTFKPTGLHEQFNCFEEFVLFVVLFCFFVAVGIRCACPSCPVLVDQSRS